MAKKIIRGDSNLAIPQVETDFSDELDIFTDKAGNGYMLIDGKLKRINNVMESVDGSFAGENLDLQTRRELTQTQYDALNPKNPKLYYFITDKNVIFFNGRQYPVVTTKRKSYANLIINPVTSSSTIVSFDLANKYTDTFSDNDVIPSSSGYGIYLKGGRYLLSASLNTCSSVVLIILDAGETEISPVFTRGTSNSGTIEISNFVLNLSQFSNINVAFRCNYAEILEGQSYINITKMEE